MTSAVLQRIETGSPASASGVAERSAIETSVGPIRLEIRCDIDSQKAVWEALQNEAPCTSNQTFDYARAWVAHVLAARGSPPVIAVGYGADGEALFLWAFERARRWGMPVLTWLGQEHANYNMGLFRPDAAAALTAEDLKLLLRHVADFADARAAVLTAQPYEWNGVKNPLALLPHQDHPSEGYAVRLGDFHTLFEARFSKNSRRGFARKEKKLAEFGPVSFHWAATRPERREVLQTFFLQKENQFREMGVDDPFSPPVRDFLHALTMLQDDNPARLWLGYIKIGEDVLATFCGTGCKDHFAVMLSSLGEGGAQRFSPGLILLKHQIEWACARGLALYDIGVGAAHHKERWCDIIRPLFDSFIAFSPAGLAIAWPLSGVAKAKRSIKRSRYLWPLSQRVRRQLFGQKSGSPSDQHD